MPFKSKAQMKFLFAQHPDIAKRWAKDYGVNPHLPEHVKKMSKKNGAERKRSGHSKTKK